MSNPNDQEWPAWIVECKICPSGHYYNSDNPEDTDSIISLDFDVCLDPPIHQETTKEND